MYQFIPANVAEDKIVFMDEENSVYRLIGGVGVFFFRETDKTLLSISNWGILILDAATAKLIESYSFAKVDPQGIATFEHVMNPRLQGDYFVFMGERTHESEAVAGRESLIYKPANCCGQTKWSRQRKERKRAISLL